MQLSDADQRQRAELVEKFKRDGPQPGVSPKLAGCNGRSVLVHDLDYVSYSDVFILPIFHAGGPLPAGCSLRDWGHVRMHPCLRAAQEAFSQAAVCCRSGCSALLTYVVTCMPALQGSCCRACLGLLQAGHGS